MHFTLSALALASLASAHFQLQWPTSAGFVDDDEGKGPCGGQTVTVNSSSTKIDVNAFSVAIRNGHPTSSFSFFASLNTSAPYTFEEITPDINSTGLGTFCSSLLYAPDSYAGKPGVLQIVADSDDGTLYQCAPVNFVSSGGDTPSSSVCFNSSIVSIVFSGAAPDASSNTTTTSNTTSSSTTSTSAAATAAATTSSSRAAAPVMTMGAGVVAGVGMVAAGLLI